MTLVSVALSLVPWFDTELEGLSNSHYRWWVCARKEPTVVPYGTEQLCSPQLYSQVGLGRPSYAQLKPEVDEYHLCVTSSWMRRQVRNGLIAALHQAAYLPLLQEQSEVLCQDSSQPAV